MSSVTATQTSPVVGHRAVFVDTHGITVEAKVTYFAEEMFLCYSYLNKLNEGHEYSFFNSSDFRIIDCKMYTSSMKTEWFPVFLEHSVRSEKAAFVTKIV
jgi:hypothetical protein